MNVLNLQGAIKCKNLSSPSISNNLYEENDYHTLFPCFRFFSSFSTLLFFCSYKSWLSISPIQAQTFFVFWRHSPTRNCFPLENFVKKRGRKRGNGSIGLFFILIWNLEISSFNKNCVCVFDVNENENSRTQWIIHVWILDNTCLLKTCVNSERDFLCSQKQPYYSHMEQRNIMRLIDALIVHMFYFKTLYIIPCVMCALHIWLKINDSISKL